MTTLKRSRHGRDRHHHLAPTEGVDLPNTRFVRAGRTLCGLPAGIEAAPAAVCPECAEIAAELAAWEASRVAASWVAWRKRLTDPRRQQGLEDLNGWPAEAAVFRDLIASRDMGPLVVPAAASIVRPSKSGVRALMALQAWRILDVVPMVLGLTRAYRLTARPMTDAKIPPREPPIEPWPGDFLAKGRRTRLILARPVNADAHGKPRMVHYRDHRGAEATILPSTWTRWAANADVVNAARRMVDRLVQKDVADCPPVFHPAPPPRSHAVR